MRSMVIRLANSPDLAPPIPSLTAKTKSVPASATTRRSISGSVRRSRALTAALQAIMSRISCTTPSVWSGPA